MYPGLAERLTLELQRLAPEQAARIKVAAPPERKYAAWIGGSILASSAEFAQMCITRQEYERER